MLRIFKTKPVLSSRYLSMGWIKLKVIDIRNLIVIAIPLVAILNYVVRCGMDYNYWTKNSTNTSNNENTTSDINGYPRVHHDNYSNENNGTLWGIATLMIAVEYQ